MADDPATAFARSSPSEDITPVHEDVEEDGDLILDLYSEYTLRTTWGSEGSSNESAQLSRRKRTKAKAARSNASGESYVELSMPEETSTEDYVEPDTTPILVKQESLRVFSKMYPIEGKAGGSVRWAQFALAMGDAGFAATEGGGSAASFSNESGSIATHKPHLDPVVDAIMLQKYGRRMRKWLGWSGERFVLRPKESS